MTDTPGDQPRPERTGSDTTMTDATAELERLRAERDEARAELGRLRATGPRRHRARRVVAAALVVVSCLSFLTGGAGIWASRSLLDTDVWVERVGPLADDPEVQAALTRFLTAEILQLADPRALFEEVLPERGQLLAVPLSGAVEGFVGDQVARFVASDTFAASWLALNEQAHATAVRILRGDSDVVVAGDRSVTLNLLPVINEVLARITSVSPELFGRTVDVPDVQIDEIPTTAIERFNERLGTDLPTDFGQVTIEGQGRLKELQDAIALFDRLVWISVVVFVFSTVGAFAASVDRRRTFYQVALGDIVLLVLMRRAAAIAQDQVLGLVRLEDNVPAAGAVTDAMLQGLFDGTRALLWLLALGLVAAWLTGRSARAVSVRRQIAVWSSSVVATTRERGADPATAAWLVAHRPALQVGGVLVGLAALWWLPLSWFGLLVLLAAVVGYQVLIARIPDPSREESMEPR